MTTRTRIVLLLALVLGALVLGCSDFDMDRTGFEATATAAPGAEMAQRAADAQATVVAERDK